MKNIKLNEANYRLLTQSDKLNFLFLLKWSCALNDAFYDLFNLPVYNIFSSFVILSMAALSTDNASVRHFTLSINQFQVLLSKVVAKSLVFAENTTEVFAMIDFP